MPSRRVPSWMLLGMAIGCAFALRWAGTTLTASPTSDPWHSQWIFGGVAITAAAIAALAGRVWGSPPAAILLAVLAGIVATRYEDHLLGASAGLFIGIALATNYVYRLARWSTAKAWGHFVPVAAGGAGGVAAAVHWSRTPGAMTIAQSAGILFAALLVAKALAVEPQASQPRPESAHEPPVRRKSRAGRWLPRIEFCGAALLGVAAVCEPLSPIWEQLGAAVGF